MQRREEQNLAAVLKQTKALVDRSSENDPNSSGSGGKKLITVGTLTIENSLVGALAMVLQDECMCAQFGAPHYIERLTSRSSAVLATVLCVRAIRYRSVV
jgi:hypothetical protein